jgi:glutaredoxin
MSSVARKAAPWRMVTPEHTCPYGLKAEDLLERQGFEVEDHILTDRAETDRFEAEHQVKSTPQTFINGARVGGFDDLPGRRWVRYA